MENAFTTATATETINQPANGARTLNSQSLSTFKASNGIEEMVWFQGKGRKFGDVLIQETGEIRKFFVAEKCDLALPLFIAEGEYEALWIFNMAELTTGTI